MGARASYFNWTAVHTNCKQLYVLVQANLSSLTCTNLVPHPLLSWGTHYTTTVIAFMTAGIYKLII